MLLFCNILVLFFVEFVHLALHVGTISISIQKGVFLDRVA